MIHFMGTEEFCHYVTAGRTVDSVKEAEHMCESGDTVISPSAWVYCAGMDIGVIVLSDGKHRKVRQVGDLLLQILRVCL